MFIIKNIYIFKFILYFIILLWKNKTLNMNHNDNKHNDHNDNKTISKD